MKVHREVALPTWKGKKESRESLDIKDETKQNTPPKIDRYACDV